MEELANLTIKLDYDSKRVLGARLQIPLLAVDEHLTQMTTIENLIPGSYDGTLVAYLTTGGETSQKVKIKIFPKSQNIHQFSLHLPNEVILKPVDRMNKTVLYTEIKVESVDANFRPVRDEKGVACRLRPGDYTVKIVLPNMEVRTVPLKVTEDTLVYSLPTESTEVSTRKEPRLQMSVPVSYLSKDGQWVMTKSINISTGGLCLIKQDDKEPDKDVQVRLIVPVLQSPVECRAKVRWEKEEGAASQMGLELNLPNDVKSTINRWLITGKA